MRIKLLIAVLLLVFTTVNGQTVTEPWAILNSAPSANGSNADGGGLLVSDASGNVYIGNGQNITKVLSTGLVVFQWASFGSEIRNMVIDLSGNIYVSHIFGSVISKVTGSGVVTEDWATISTGIIWDMDIDGSNNIFTANDNNTVSKISPSGIVVQDWATSVSNDAFGLQIGINKKTGTIYLISSSSGLEGSLVSKITSSGVVNSSWAFMSYIPTTIAVDGTDNVFVSSYDKTQISKISSSGVITPFWKTLASNPSWIGFDGTGNLFTTNYNKTISKISTNGTLTYTWAILNKVVGGLSISASGNLFTFGDEGTLSKISAAGVVNLNYAWIRGQAMPTDIKQDSKGNFYTTNLGNGTISKIKADGTTTEHWVKMPLHNSINSMAIAPTGDMYLIGGNLHSVSKVTVAGVFTIDWTKIDFNTYTTAIALDPQGNIYTANSNNTISKISPAGVLTSNWAYLGSQNRPQVIIIDALGTVYTANENNTISKVTSSAVVTPTWATLASNAQPRALDFDASGNIYTANMGNSTISKIFPDGHVVESWASLDKYAGPSDLKVDASGNIYTANLGNNTISKITPSGVVTQAWVTLANGTGPRSILIDDAGIIYTSNYNSSTVSKIEPPLNLQLPISGTTSASATITDGNALDFQQSGYLITTITPSGSHPVSGALTATVNVDGSVQSHNNQPYVTRHYQIEPAVNGSTSTATVKLYFSQADFDAYNDNIATNTLGLPLLPVGPNDVAGIGHVTIIQYHGSGSLPQDYSGAPVIISPLSNNVVWNADNQRWEITIDIDGFSGFFLSAVDKSLPVSVSGFGGSLQNEVAHIKWQTGEENDLGHFELESSHTVVDFYNIAIFAPKGSNSNYVYDSQQPTSLAFYRLKIVEKDGHVSYGPVISLLQNDSKDDLVIYPNPAHGHLFVEAAFSGPFKLYNASGRLVLSQIVKKGRNDIWLSNLRPGIYFGLLKGHKVNIVIK